MLTCTTETVPVGIGIGIGAEPFFAVVFVISIHGLTNLQARSHSIK